MSKSIATALRSQTTQSRPSSHVSLVSSEEIGKWLERNGFIRSVAGDDFQTVSRAVAESVSTHRGLFLTGPCGCGKTHLLKTIFTNGRSESPKYWIDCYDQDSAWLLNRKENPRMNEMFGMSLFIDDLGTEVKVEYGRRTDYIAEFIRQYHSRGTGRLYITSNLSSDDTLRLYDERIVDRIMDMCVVCRMSGTSKRTKTVII